MLVYDVFQTEGIKTPQYFLSKSAKTKTQMLRNGQSKSNTTQTKNTNGYVKF